MFDHMTDKALKLGFDKAVDFFKNMPVTIGTMCSGTEAPVLAADMIKQRKYPLQITRFISLV